MPPEPSEYSGSENIDSSSQSEGMLEDGNVVTVRVLLKGLYEKACQQKLWGLVRHTAGMLGKRVEDLAKAVTDLLVRQKQVSRFLFLHILSFSSFFFFYKNEYRLFFNT